ncbi:MAG TPA: riboflavin synthase [Solirubrobacteraceae bacterium]|jgi:riboflavin synthase|nr:riboflavin synthase [Solirubrobacteraceae bacterium]
MFTGLVEDLGELAEVERSPEGARLIVRTRLAGELRDGDSVAVNGVCLTAAAVDGDRFAADAMNATLLGTSLGDLEARSPVNLELPLRPSDRLGGHIVQGHVDGVGRVAESQPDGFARRLRIETAPELLRYVVAKGSIAVDGVSLTVADLDERSFTVSLIPETLERTTLGTAEAGTRVNLEVDMLAKYVEKLVAR